MRSPVTVAVIAVATTAVLSSCKARPTDGASVKADFDKNRKPTQDQTWTEARTIALDEYAADLLRYDGNESKKFNELQLQVQQSLATAGVQDGEPLSSYTLKLGPYSECFGEESGDYNIWWTSHRDSIAKQIEEAAYFIRDFHYRMLGRNKGMFTFREVILCPEAKLGQKMRLDGYKLYIGIPYSRGYYTVIPNKAASGSDSLESLWTSGAPIGVDKPDRSFLKSLLAKFQSAERARIAANGAWRLFNPTSFLRVSIRQMLHESGRDLGQRLAALRRRFGGANLTSDAASIRREIETEVLGEGNPETSLVDNERVAGGVMAAFKELDAAGLNTLLANWECFVTNSAHRADIEADAVGMISNQMQNETNNINKDVSAGLVAVVNHHRVGVNVQGAVGPYRKYVAVVTDRETNINTRVRAGLVAVDTSDDISVNLGFAVDTGRAMQTAGFERAVNAAASGRDLCRE